VTVVWGDDARAFVRAEMAKLRPLEAQRWLAKLEKAAARLELFPYSGHSLPEVPRLAILETPVQPYRLIYFVGDEEVTIITVCHSRESLEVRWEPSLALVDEG